MATARHLELMREAGITIPKGAENDGFLTADNFELLGDLLINSLALGQEPSPKSDENGMLMSYLADSE